MKSKKRIKYTGEDKRIKKFYDSKKGLKSFSFDEFKNWFIKQEDKCIYCNLTSQETLILFNKYPLSTRKGKRGRRLELDRINPHLGYGHSLKNLALACYWCNNAKTNYFSLKEFKQIGEIIGKVHQNRLKLIQNKS
jgi:hypothetical protein